MSFILTRSEDAASIRGKTLKIGLLNNLGDGALESGERQVIELLASAACDRAVSLSLFTLPSIMRGAKAKAHISARYAPLDVLLRGDLDGLIVTGCEPRAATLPEETFWHELTEVVDWAEHHTRSTAWSCLAAHAAVLHLDGVARRRLSKKCSGLFQVSLVAPHPLFDGVTGPLFVPHSRWNALDEDTLVKAGYQILTQGDVGVDTFFKQWRSLFVFLQGHPEYDANALCWEYRRDVDRYVAGFAVDYPTIPSNYLDPTTEAKLTAFEAQARLDRKSASTRGPLFPAMTPTFWPRAGAHAFFRNWLRLLGTPTEGQSAPKDAEPLAVSNERRIR